MKVPEPRKLPSGTWFIQLRLDGVSVPVTASTAKACKNKAALIKAEHKAGKRVIEHKAPTLGAVLDSYIEKRSAVLSPSTIRGYKAYKRVYFQSVMDEPVNTIDWQAAVNEEAEDGTSPKTIKNAWGLVRSALLDYGITATVRLPAQTRGEKEWLTAEQIPAFMDAIRGTPGEIGALLALSSLRRSEIYGLDWADIDLENNVIHVRSSVILGVDAKPVKRDQNKTASSTRDVPIFLPRLEAALKAVEDKTGSVVTGNVGTLRKRIQRACEAAGLPDVGVHGLRHSFASLCYHLGVSELGAMQIGGWSDFQTMRKIYTHISETDKKKSADKLQSFFKNANKNANKLKKVQ
jgi:integrase